ncbi:hypothetical protein TKK_0010824 [Trichogramma kaykai]
MLMRSLVLPHLDYGAGLLADLLRNNKYRRRLDYFVLCLLALTLRRGGPAYLANYLSFVPRDVPESFILVWALDTLVCPKILIKSDPNYDNTLEFLILELSYLNVLMLFAVVYARAHCPQLESFFDALTTISSNYPNIVVTGDFNTNLAVSNLQTAINLRNLIKFTHALQSSVQTDYRLGDSTSVGQYSKTSEPFLSAHDLIELRYCVPVKPPNSPNTIQSRRLGSVDPSRLQDLLTSQFAIVSADPASPESGVDAAVASYSTLLHRSEPSRFAHDVSSSPPLSNDDLVAKLAIPIDLNRPVFNLGPITPAEILKIARKSSSRALGPDSISAHMIRMATPALIEPLVKIVNFSIKTGVFPRAWLHTLIMPLAKQFVDC